MRFFSSVAALAAVSLPFSGQDTAAPGFQLVPAVLPGGSPFAVSTTLSTGEILVFDGDDLVLFASDGTPVRTVASLGVSTFPSFVVLDASEQLVYFGESSTGGIYEAFLPVGNAPDLLATLGFPYDAAVDPSGHLFVSTSTCGFGCGNEIWRIDVDTLALRLVARVPGASGPVAFDGDGWLYYGTATAQFPPPPKPSAVYRWSPQQIAGPLALDLDDAEFVGGAFAGAARMAFDPRTDALYLLENNFSTGENRIRRVLGSADESPVVVEGRPFRSMNDLVVHPGTGAARLLPFQPTSDATIGYTTSDFVAPPERLVVTARRAEASLSGPGLSGPGPVDLALAGGPPGGFARVLFCPSALYSPTEHVVSLSGLPLFFGLHPGTTSALPGAFVLDAQGAFQQTFFNPGGLEGLVALQLLLIDSRVRIAGTSTAAFL